MRRPYDFYETPPHYVAALLDHVQPWGTVYEPCVGDHAIARYLRREVDVACVRTNDLDPAREADRHYDARTPEAWGWVTPTWVVSNTTFSHVFEIAQQAVASVPSVALLVRLSFFEPTVERGPWLEAHPPSSIIVLPRYSFRNRDNGKKGHDNVTCAWAVWDRIPHPTSVPGVHMVSAATAMVSAARRGFYE